MYTRIGVRPFINSTARYTINSGAKMLPEVISTIAQASNHHVNLDALIEKVGDVELGEYGRAHWRARRHAASG